MNKQASKNKVRRILMKLKSTTTKSKTNPGKLLNEKFIIEFPLSFSLFQVGKTLELELNQNPYYDFRFKKDIQNINIKANMTEIKTQNQLKKIEKVIF